MSKRCSVRSIIVLAAPTSAWRMNARRLDVHDDAELHVNQIIVRIGKERWSAQARPLSGGIGRRDELRRHVAGCPECRVIKRGEILLGRAAYRLCIKLFVPPWPGR